MEHKDWKQVEELFHAAVSLSPEERGAYLSRACSEDPSTRAEVESLIAAFEGSSQLMEQSAFNLGMKVLSTPLPEASLVGKLIGNYRILAPLGQGGMGEVYLAEDSRLDRKVALKFLSNKFVDDAWGKRQLVKEAQAVAKLDHPNICAVYGFEEEDSHNFIVMQYCEGETLASLIEAGQLDPKDIPNLAIKIISAIAEAHSHGIIHRDIKPQNIIVTTSGQVKVLDFGLAKLVQQRQTVEGVGNSESLSSQMGLVIGTVSYMSPEQLRAERLDFRTDIFSFGIVLYEMISGKNPYSRGSNAEIISAILSTDPPPLKNLPTGVPVRVARAAQKCLNRDREQRYQSASELLLDLDNLEERRDAVTRQRNYFTRRLLIAVVLLLIVAAGIFEYLRLTSVPTLGIIPIVYESSNPNTEHLGVALTDSLVKKLSRLSGLRVKAPTFVPSREKEEPQRIGRSLGVDKVLSATISERNTILVLEIALVDASEGSMTLKDEYEINPEQVLSVAENISTRIAAALHMVMSEDEKRSLTKRQTDHPDAFKEYFRGRHYWNRRTADDLKRAITHFNSAIEFDPAYAEAHSGLADCYVLMGIAGYGGLSTAEAMRLARAAGEKALELDSTLGEAHTSLAIARMFGNWNWEEAEREFKLAISLKPNYPAAHYWYTTLLALRGRSRESIVSSEKASELEPLSPQYDINVGRAFYYARDYDKAAVYTAKSLEKAPNGQTPLYMAGLVHIQKGQLSEAIELLERVYAASKSFGGAPLGYAYARVGRRADALRVLDEIAKEPAQEKAIVLLGLGETERALTMLQQACDDHHATFPFVFIEPLFDDLRSEPKFAELAQCAHIEL